MLRRTARSLSGTPFLLALGVLLAAPAAAATGRWRVVEPFGGRITVLAATGDGAAGTVYAATETAGVFRSDDGAATWVRASGRLPGVHVSALAAAPGDPDRALAWVRDIPPGALFRTLNGGSTWARAGTGLPTALALAFAPGDPETAYAATTQGVFRSADGGATWSLLGLADLVVLAVTIDPRQPRTLWAGVGFGFSDGVHKSTDAGATWARVLPEVQAFGIAVDPTDPRRVYTLSYPLHRSLDGGVTWGTLDFPFGVNALGVAPDGTLFAAAFSGVFRSRDGGATWSPWPYTNRRDLDGRPLDSVESFVFPSPGQVLAGGRQGVWSAAVAGGAWRAASHGIAAQRVSALATAEAGWVYASAVEAGIFRSRSEGLRFRRVGGRGLPSQRSGGTVEALAVHPEDPLTLYAGGADGIEPLLVSRDAGETWRSLPYRGSPNIERIVFDPTDPDVFYVGGLVGTSSDLDRCHLSRTDDGGETWACLSSLEGIGGPNQVRALVVDPRRPATLYVLPGLWKSVDSGDVWRLTGRGLPADAISLAIDPVQTSTLYAGTFGKGVYRSDDGGESWRRVSRSLPAAPITAILVDPRDPRVLYAGVAGVGVFRSVDRGARWAPLGRGLPGESFVSALALDPAGAARLFAGTDGRGLYRLDL